MSETLSKLRPDRDLQCYFQLPSAAAALSQTSPTGFTVSGTWRQQFDWAVVEWNRDNVFEHPQLRNLPDGDLSGVVLNYQETRVNCIQPDSTLYPTVDWPSLRIWANPGSGEQVYYVPLFSPHRARPVSGSYVQASATFTLTGTTTVGDRIELEWAENHYNYTIASGDTLETAAGQLALIINSFSTIASAVANGAAITLTILSTATAYAGANGNWLGAYGTVSGLDGTEQWQPAAQQFSGGQSPTTWSYSLDFSNLCDVNDLPIPTNNIRKMRWTYAADFQPAEFQSGDFSVTVSDWQVTGTNLTYSVSGPGSRRIEDTDNSVAYTNNWTPSQGNFSGGFIHYTTTPLSACTCRFVAERVSDVYIGTRMAPDCAQLTYEIDGVVSSPVNLLLSAEDVLIRLPVGTVQPGDHTITVQHTGTAGTYLYFDFIELAVPSQQLPTFANYPKMTLATDWDTEHSSALAPERTAWLINTLGFTGRANHYVGALWFFELVRPGQVYATGSITFGGTAEANKITTISIGTAGSGQSLNTISHLHLSGDTTETIAQAFALMLNSGYTSVWATASGNILTIQARAMGTDGNSVTIAVSTNSTMTVTASGSQLSGGIDGITGGVNDSGDYCGWRTDLTAVPRINRACRDWTTSFFKALYGHGIQATGAFSMELQFGDPSAAAGIAQRYPSGAPAILTTPSLQTNFSPASLAFWQQAYADLAQLMVNSGQIPYLQFGEVQWWYFASDGSGLPLYDAYTQSQFSARYGRPMAIITVNTADPASYPDEAQFLPALIGSFTQTIQQFVAQSQPGTQFEVLYPPDTNAYSFNEAINLPRASWTPATLNCFKTENFTFTGERNLVVIDSSIQLPMQMGFPISQASHLAGISDPSTPWQKEVALAAGAGVESIVLFALDQYCLIGYPYPLPTQFPRSFMIR
jgi:hypothetical protein